MRNGIFICLFIALASLASMSTFPVEIIYVAGARVIYVPDNYSTIQSAVNQALDGDTIIVRNGNYIESITVNKPLTIRSENGPAKCTVRGGFSISADSVIIEGFTITGASYAGMYIGSKNCKVVNNIITNNGGGIQLGSAGHQVIQIINNTISNNSGTGIMVFSSSNIISSNAVSNNTRGIYLWGYHPESTGYFCDNNSITNNVLLNNKYALFFFYSSYNILTNNTMTENLTIYGSKLSHYLQEIDTSNMLNGKPIYYLTSKKGMYLSTNASYVAIVNSSDVTVKKLTMTKGDQGVLLAYSSNCRVENVNASAGYYGILLRFSNNNTITNSYWRSISLQSSSNNTFTNNIASGQENCFGISGEELSHFVQNIDTSNKVNGKPIYYLVNEREIPISNDAGYVGIINSSNIVVKNVTLSDNNEGVLLAYSNNCRVENVKTYNNFDSVSLYYCNDTIVIDNDLSATRTYFSSSIHLTYSCNNLIANNTLSNSSMGIQFTYSHNNTITNNDLSGNGRGIYLEYSNENVIISNNATHNNEGIWIESGVCNTVIGNIVSNNGEEGVLLWSEFNSVVSNNTVSSNSNRGIRMEFSDNNKIVNNEISKNRYGVFLGGSVEHNRIYLNNFVNNTKNCHFEYSSSSYANIWNSESPIKYTYKGKTRSSYMGNYWSDYDGEDTNEDGIGDTYHNLGWERDDYPLMDRFEKYTPPGMGELTPPETTVSIGSPQFNQKAFSTSISTQILR